MKKIASDLYLDEFIDNQDIKYRHLEAKRYFPVNVTLKVSGEEVPALFTWNQIKTAMERAHNNPEDIQNIQAMSRFEKFVKNR